MQLNPTISRNNKRLGTGHPDIELETLKRQSHLGDLLVLHFSWAKGAMFVPKSMTFGANRCSAKIYFDADSAGLILAFSITSKGCRGRSKGVADFLFFRKKIYYAFDNATATYSAAGAYRARFQNEGVRGVLEKEISNAASSGEWKLIAHDATYEAALGILGQTKHGPIDAPPTDYRAVHTFRRISGLPRGFLARTTSLQSVSRKL